MRPRDPRKDLAIYIGLPIGSLYQTVLLRLLRGAARKDEPSFQERPGTNLAFAVMNSPARSTERSASFLIDCDSIH